MGYPTATNEHVGYHTARDAPDPAIIAFMLSTAVIHRSRLRRLDILTTSTLGISGVDPPCSTCGPRRSRSH
jgi:hypothetical protein